MTFKFDLRRFKLFLWIAVAYTSLWMLSNVFQESDTFFQRIPNEIWRALYVMIMSFAMYEYALPFVWTRKNVFLKIITGLFLLWVFLMFYSFGLYGWRALGILLHVYIPLRSDPTITEGVAYHFPYSVGAIIFFGIIRHVYDYRQLKITAQLLRIQKQEAELSYLKAQTHPHFLFNTLNNIYALARDKSSRAPESIMRLSKILRFMLYETSGDYITIEKELKIIADYIELEKLRYDDSLVVNFNVDVEDLLQPITPLLLIPLIENAFKHGVAETRNLPFIHIDLHIKDRLLRFLVRNSAESSREDVKENIGLSNLRRQLELLYADFDLVVNHDAGVFTASMRVNLSSHV